MKRVLFDYTYYQSGAFHGGGEYGDAVLDRLLSEQGEFGLFYLDSMKCREDWLEKCENRGWEIFSISEYKELPELITEYRYDVLYSALPYQPGRSGVILPDSVLYIATYHGMRELELMDYKSILQGELLGLRESEEYKVNLDFYDTVLRSAKNKKIITDSRHSKYSMLQYFPYLKESEIEVLYPPMKKTGVIAGDENGILTELGIKTNNYALIVSGGIYYKNALRTAIAYDRFFSRKAVCETSYKVVITGVENPNDILNAVENKDRFLVLPYISSNLLEILYKNTHTFVFPSINEGFGYPPLEAMKYGVFCMCAASSAITEICGDMVLYFNPLFISEIENRILQSFAEDIRKQYMEKQQAGLIRIHRRQQEDLEKLVKDIVES